jgi:shikimate kinase
MRLHNYLNEGINDKGIFKAIFMAGSPGAGKSWTLTKIRSGSIEPKSVNTDKMYPFFKEFWGGEAWGKIKDDVKTISKNQLVLYINSLLPLAVDGTANDPSMLLRRRGILESFGYDTGMVFVNTSMETALKRASKRERPVDPEFITQAYKQVQKLKNYYRSRFDDWFEISNDEGELTNEVILRGFKFASSFYESKLDNPIGKEHREKMIKNGWKTLSPNIWSLEAIQRAANGWYK